MAASEIASAEAFWLLSSGIAAEHAALLFEAIAANHAAEAQSIDIEVVSSGPDSVGMIRDTGYRSCAARTIRRSRTAGSDRRFRGTSKRRDTFAVLAERMRARPELSVRLCLNVRPRSLNEVDGSHAGLHAKCVVVDGENAFIGSANFTEAARLRNNRAGTPAPVAVEGGNGASRLFICAGSRRVIWEVWGTVASRRR